MAESKMQTDDLKRLADLTTAMVEQGRAVSDAWNNIYQDGMSYIYNNQLGASKRKKGWPAVVMNLIYPATRQERAMLAQRKPTIIPQALRKADAEKAKFWKALLQHRFEKTLDMRARCREAQLDGKVFGWYIAKVSADKRARWDADERRWRYEPRVTVIHPRFFGMDPNAEQLDDAQYVYCQRSVPADWAINQWPESKKIIRDALRKGSEDDSAIAGLNSDILGSIDAENAKGKPVDTDDPNGRIVDLLQRARSTLTLPYSADAEKFDGRGESVVITEVYFRDPEMSKGKETERYDRSELEELGALRYDAESDANLVADADSPAYKEVSGFKSRYANGQALSMADWPEKVVDEWDEPRFPFGRVIFKVNNEILNPKKADQVWEESHWPFVVGVNEQLPHVPQGMNAVEMPRGAQDWVNISASHLLNWLCYHGDPVTVVTGKPFQKKSKLSNVAGKIWHMLDRKSGSVERLPAPALSSGVLDIFQTMMRSGQDATGVHDPQLGATSGPKTAHEIATLQSNMQVGVGLQMLFMDEWIVRVMERVAELDRHHLEPGDMLRVAGDEFEDRIQEFTDEARDVEFDLTLKVGMALPHDQERRKQDAERLKQAMPQNPEIDRLLLDAFEVDNVEEVLESNADYAEFQQWKEQMQAEEEALAAQAEAQQGIGGQLNA